MIDWTKYGFKEDSEYRGVYTRPDFELAFAEENGFIKVWNASDLEYVVSEGKIPATNQSVVLLLKAFALPKL